VVHPAPCVPDEGEPTGAAMDFTIACRRWELTEVLVGECAHDRQLWNASDAEIEQFCFWRRIESKIETRCTLQVRQHF